MKQIEKVAALLCALLLSCACQKAIAPGGNSNTANANANANAQQAGQPPAPTKTHLKIGDVAPDFTLTDTNGSPVRLADFRGKKNVVLAFYVLAFTGG